MLLRLALALLLLLPAAHCQVTEELFEVVVHLLDDGMGMEVTVPDEVREGHYPTIGKLHPGGAGALAGLRQGDRIIAIQGVDLHGTSAQSMVDLFEGLSKVVSIEIQRRQVGPPGHEPPPGYEGVVLHVQPRQARGPLGLQLELHEGEARKRVPRIRHVTPHSPGQRAGFLPGDMVSRIRGHSVINEPLGRVQALFREIVRSSGAVQVEVWRRRSAEPAPPAAKEADCRVLFRAAAAGGAAPEGALLRFSCAPGGVGRQLPPPQQQAEADRADGSVVVAELAVAADAQLCGGAPGAEPPLAQALRGKVLLVPGGGAGGCSALDKLLAAKRHGASAVLLSSGELHDPRLPEPPRGAASYGDAPPLLGVSVATAYKLSRMLARGAEDAESAGNSGNAENAENAARAALEASRTLDAQRRSLVAKLQRAGIAVADDGAAELREVHRGATLVRIQGAGGPGEPEPGTWVDGDGFALRAAPKGRGDAAGPRAKAEVTFEGARSGIAFTATKALDARKDPFAFRSTFGGGALSVDFGGVGLEGKDSKMEPIALDVHLSLEQLDAGVNATVTVARRSICPTCDGSGARAPADVRTCPMCGGAGTVKRRDAIAGGMAQEVAHRCPSCHGYGKRPRPGTQCPTCRGRRFVEEQHAVEIAVEAGAADGQQLVKAAQGNEMPRRPRGDVVLTLRTKEHALFERGEGSDLAMAVNITLEEALAGWRRNVTHPNGTLISVGNDGLTAPGQVLYVEDAGLPLPVEDDAADDDWDTLEVHFGEEAGDRGGAGGPGAVERPRRRGTLAVRPSIVYPDGADGGPEQTHEVLLEEEDDDDEDVEGGDRGEEVDLDADGGEARRERGL